MKGFDTVSEFGAAAAGQIVASLLSPESYVGWSVKGASWGVRAMKAALQQAGIAGAADLGVQWNLVKAGVQDKIDLSQTAGAAAGGAVVGSAVGAITPPTGNAKSGHVGITPEGPPQQQPKQQATTPELEVDGPISVAPKSDTPELATQEVPGPSVLDVPTSSEAQAVVSKEEPTASQVPGDREVVSSVAPGQRAADAQGGASDALPSSPRLKDGEPVPRILASETKDVAPTTSRVGSEKEQTQVSSDSQVANPKKWERVDLNMHESANGEYHTIAKHVAKDFVFLQNRLDTETWLKRVSTFVDDRQAHAAIHMVIDSKAEEVAKWLANPKSLRERPFSFVPPAGSRGYAPTGLILERKTSRFISGGGAKVYLRKDQSMPNGFRIITSYPIP